MTPEIRRVSQAFRDAFDQSRASELNFPTSLDVGRRILKAVENPDIGLSTLTKIVISEPLLSAKLIRLANSTAMNPDRQEVSNLRQAVIRVGMDPVRTLAMALILNQLRRLQGHGNTREISNRLWERSIDVAAIAYVVARKMTSLNPDEAMLAGIVHDLGRFYLLSQTAAWPELLDDPEELARLIGELSGQAARRVFDELKLPEPVVEAIRASEEHRGHAMPPASLGDVLFIARTLSPRPDPFAAPAPEDGGERAADALGLDQGAIAEVIAASGDEIYSIVIALET